MWPAKLCSRYQICIVTAKSTSEHPPTFVWSKQLISQLFTKQPAAHRWCVFLEEINCEIAFYCYRQPDIPESIYHSPGLLMFTYLVKGGNCDGL